MDRHVELLEKQRVFDEFFKIDSVLLRHTRFDGTMTPVLSRLIYRRNDAVAALLRHRERNTLILVEQFRPPVYLKGDEGWITELPAGLMDVDGEEPLDTMHRELLEETGYRAPELEHILTYYTTPGGATERMWLYYGEVTDDDRIEDGGGVDAGEDLRVIEMTREQLATGIYDGTIVDAKTIIAVQWYLAHK